MRLLLVALSLALAAGHGSVNAGCSENTAVTDCTDLACVPVFPVPKKGDKLTCQKCHTLQKLPDGTEQGDCPNDSLRCNAQGYCNHKALMPVDNKDIVSFILVVFACILAASGGIGGGGLLVPLFILVSGFAANRASPMSSATITGGAIANYYSYCKRYHPEFDQGKRKPLIDYDTALLIMPALLLGTIFGTIFNKIFPEWLFLALMFALMIKYSVRTTKKGISKYKAETKQREAEESLLAGGGEPKGGGGSQFDGEPKPPLFPIRGLVITAVAWVLTFLISLFKGKKGTPSAIGVHCGTGGYWAVTIAGVLLLGGLTLYIRKGVLDEIKETGQQGDIKWTPKNTLQYPAICVICGIMAGLMGIGGGMVVGPLLIELGVVPQVVAATSAYTVLITASSATVQFCIGGTLQYDYAAVVASIGLVATFFGQWVVDGMIKKYNRASVIIFAIALIMIIATCLLGYTGITQVVNQAKAGSSFGFRPLC